MADLDYEKAKDRIEDFLRHFYTENDEQDGGLKSFKYQDQIAQLAQRKQIALCIEQDDVYLHDPELYDWINGNTVRFRHLFYEVVQKMVQEVLGDEQVCFLLYWKMKKNTQN